MFKKMITNYGRSFTIIFHFGTNFDVCRGREYWLNDDEMSFSPFFWSSRLPVGLDCRNFCDFRFACLSKNEESCSYYLFPRHTRTYIKFVEWDSINCDFTFSFLLIMYLLYLFEVLQINAKIVKNLTSLTVTLKHNQKRTILFFKRSKKSFFVSLEKISHKIIISRILISNSFDGYKYFYVGELCDLILCLVCIIFLFIISVFGGSHYSIIVKPYCTVQHHLTRLSSPLVNVCECESPFPLPIFIYH